MASGNARPDPGAVRAFLVGRHGSVDGDLEPLSGGFWSSAYGYRAAGRDLVVRLGQIREGFDMDREAMAYARPGLPVPEVLEIGEAFGGAYAISVRYRGRFLESVEPREADVAGPTIVRLLAALKSVQAPSGSPSWHQWLRDGLVDHPGRTVSGWRPKLARHPHAESVYEAACARVRELVPACPERRDLVHGDLLHANVLVSEDASTVNAVFSWKCSTWGDFLFDTAWCTFWSPWHPGIAAAEVFGRMLRDPSVRPDPGALRDAAERHHCYEVHIGATHIGWNVWTDDADGLRSVVDHTAAILDRGPTASLA